MEMKEKQTMLMQLRIARGLTRKELARQSGINFRSLQDYEQGHKDITSAKADTVYRLSVALGCNMEVLLQPANSEIQNADQGQRNRLLTYYLMLMKNTLQSIENLKIYSAKYQTHGRLILKTSKYYLTFCYNGEIVELPFEAIISEQTLPWLEDVALLQMNSYIRDREFENSTLLPGGIMYDER